MIKHVNLFNTNEEYIAFKHSNDFVLPNLTVIKNNNEVFLTKNYPNQYFTIESLENDNQISFTNDIMYSTDGSSWDTLTSEESLLINNGVEVNFKINNPTFGEYGIGTFSATKQYNVKGNVMSLLCGDDFIGKTDLSSFGEYVFSKLFDGSTTLIDASNLILPATTLAYGCYYQMFRDCSSLTTAPELPATTLAYSCYANMFESCESLTTAPELPATTLAYYCYSNMFYCCSSLTTAPELPATTLANYCYQYMFQGCSSLTTAPSILPATILTNGCYSHMFNGCSSLTTSPELPATTLATSCYSYMFNGCSSLTTAPELPSTTLAERCYSNMFSGCKSLTTAPELPSTTLATYCYYQMFKGCESLNNITMLATDVSASSCLSNWVSGVAANGTFTKASSMTSLPSGNSGIPEGWTVINY